MSEGGIHIHAHKMLDPSDTEGDCLLKVEVYPLPQPIAEALSTILSLTINLWLTEQGLTEGEAVDMSNSRRLQ